MLRRTGWAPVSANFDRLCFRTGNVCHENMNSVFSFASSLTLYLHHCTAEHHQQMAAASLLI